MSDLSFEQMLEQTFKDIHVGSFVVGKIIDIKEDLAVLNVGYKSDGILTRNEYGNDASLDLRTVLHVGDELEVKVLKINDGEGQLMLSYKRIAQDKARKKLEDAFVNHKLLKEKVSRIVNGGVCVDIEGNRVFIPASLMSDPYERDLAKYQDQEIEFVLTEFNPKRRRIIGDRKQIITERKAQLRKQFFENHAVGDTVEGTVSSVPVFGAFVNIDGVEGLLHVTEMSWLRISNPKNACKVGDKIKVFIKDMSNDRISLSRKFPEENPWKDAQKKYPIGTVVKGKIIRLADFGAFIEVEKGIDGLEHVSQLVKRRIEHPSEAVEVGQTVEALVVGVDEAAERLSLSIRAFQAQKRNNGSNNEEADTDGKDIAESAADDKENSVNDKADSAANEAVQGDDSADGAVNEAAGGNEGDAAND